MSVGDMQFEIDQQRAAQAKSADVAWQIETVLYDALQEIIDGGESPIEISKQALYKRNDILNKFRSKK